MNKFFITPDEIAGDEIRITGPDVNHIKNVLRMRPGEEVLAGVRSEGKLHSEADAGDSLGHGASEYTIEERNVSDVHEAGGFPPETDSCDDHRILRKNEGSWEGKETDGLWKSRKTGSSQEGREYLCRIREITADEVTLEILDYTRTARELPSRITLFQGLPKSDKMELIVQKAVELGAYAVAPVAMKRSIVKIEEKKKDAKRKRWQAIAESAAAQSKRSVIPEVLPVMSFPEALKAAAKLDVVLLPYEDAKGMETTRRELSAIRPGQSVGVFIGPEGGFAEEEVAAAKEAGAKVITLGNRILRTETAGLMVLSVLGYLLET